MTIAKALVQKLSAFIGGGIAFSVPWLLIDPYWTALGITVRTAASLGACLIVALLLDSGVYRLGIMRQGSTASRKPKNDPKDDDDEKTAFLCPNCGKTYAKPIRVMDPKTEAFLYSACPKCGKPLNNPQLAPMAAAAAQAPAPSELPKQPSNTQPPAPAKPEEVAQSLGVPPKQLEPPPAARPARKPIRIEVLVHQPDEE
jgi:predicted RNA-binding Zn-ribbon protein involved in translation (DUF1610 family)